MNAEALDLKVPGAGDENEESELDLISRVTGRRDSLRNTILFMVAAKKWRAAARELAIYRDIKSEVLVFEKMTGQYFELSIACIKVIEELLSYPDLELLPYSARSQIKMKTLHNFERLTQYLTKIETCENDIKVRDIHSTKWIARALIVTITLGAFALAADEGLRTLGLPIQVLALDIANFIFTLVGL